MKYDLPEEGVYVGEIIAYTDCGFYEIRYTNGDGEELSEEDVTMYVEEERQAETRVFVGGRAFSFKQKPLTGTLS